MGGEDNCFPLSPVRLLSQSSLMKPWCPLDHTNSSNSSENDKKKGVEMVIMRHLIISNFQQQKTGSCVIQHRKNKKFSIENIINIRAWLTINYFRHYMGCLYYDLWQACTNSYGTLSMAVAYPQLYIFNYNTEDAYILSSSAPYIGPTLHLIHLAPTLQQMNSFWQALLYKWKKLWGD